MTDRMPPDTGPAFSQLENQLAVVLVQACGVKVAYTLTIALQTLAAANDDSDPLLLTAAECYTLANAMLQHIPADYMEPELPPPPPPNDGPSTPEQDAARERVRQIQEASKPTASFRE